MAKTSTRPSPQKTYREGGRITKPEAKEFLENNVLPDNNYNQIEFHDVTVHSVTRPEWAKLEAGVYSFFVEYRTDKDAESPRVTNDVPLRRTADGSIKVVLLR